MKKKYNQVLTSKNNYAKADIISRSKSNSTIRKYVPNANRNILVEMNDFEGKSINSWTVTNHCAPTAGTNIIKYWSKCRGVNKLYHNSDWWIFSSLCVHMKTNEHNATYKHDIYNGLYQYGTNIGVKPTGADQIFGHNYSQCRQIINSGVPFILVLNSYKTGGGHAVSCFGYYESNGKKYLIINNGWDKCWRFEEANQLNISFLAYSRWN